MKTYHIIVSENNINNKLKRFTMAFFSKEPSTYKSWLIANMSLWGWLPAAVISIGINLLANLIYPNPNFVGVGVIAAYCLFWGTLLFRAEQEFYIAPFPLIHTIGLLAPIIVLYIIFTDDTFEFSTFSKIWLAVCYPLSLLIAKAPAQYAYENFNDMVSRTYRLRTSRVKQHTSRLRFTFIRFVECFYFIYVILSAFASFL